MTQPLSEKGLARVFFTHGETEAQCFTAARADFNQFHHFWAFERYSPADGGREAGSQGFPEA